MSHIKRSFNDNMDKFINEYCNTNNIYGSLRVTVKDEVIYEKFIGWADYENKTAFTKNSLFTMYSLSKPFCAIGLLKLKDKKLIDIDNHPRVYLPEATGFDKSLKIRHLLNHTSGIPDFSNNTDFPQKYSGETAHQIREKLVPLSKMDVLFKPGERVEYANINYIICALIIENVSGIAYAEYMQKEVFEPMGMHNTCIDNKHLVLNNRVKGHCIQNNNIVSINRVTEWILGGADVVSTVDDVYCLNKAIKHKSILKPDTWDEVLTASPDSVFGFGCAVTLWHGKKRIQHNGGWDGFRTIHIQLPEDDFDIIFLSNCDWRDARYDVAEAVYNAYYGADSEISQSVKMDAGYI